MTGHLERCVGKEPEIFSSEVLTKLITERLPSFGMMVVLIDGPSGAGKSTLGRLVSQISLPAFFQTPVSGTPPLIPIDCWAHEKAYRDRQTLRLRERYRWGENGIIGGIKHLAQALTNGHTEITFTDTYNRNDGKCGHDLTIPLSDRYVVVEGVFALSFDIVTILRQAGIETIAIQIDAERERRIKRTVARAAFLGHNSPRNQILDMALVIDPDWTAYSQTDMINPDIYAYSHEGSITLFRRL